MIGVEEIKNVRHLRLVDGLSIREISKRTKLSRNTVRKIIRSNDTAFEYKRQYPGPVAEPIEELLRAWVKEDSKVRNRKYKRTSKKMYNTLCMEHGYKGSYKTVTRLVNDIQKELKIKQKEAFIPLYFEPGEAYQFDWGDVTVYIKDKLVTLQLAALQLSHSRVFFAKVYPCQKREMMLDAHCCAFELFGGVCQRGIYDNLKSAVKRVFKGRTRELQEGFIRFCSHYLIEPDFCTPAKGNEKGRVESLIKMIRRDFFTPYQRLESLEELNDRLLTYCMNTAKRLKHPDFPEKTRYEVFGEEKNLLVPLPEYRYECCRIQHGYVSPFSLAPFDNNRYSVPVEYVGESVIAKGFSDEVVFVHKGKEIARHKRVFGKSHRSFDPLHYIPLLEKKPGALRNGLPFRHWELPSIFEKYKRVLYKKYPDGDRYYARTLMLLRDWSMEEVTTAIERALKIGVAGDNYILTLLRKNNEPVYESDFNIKSQLAKYKAVQRPSGYYDHVLRFGKEV